MEHPDVASFCENVVVPGFWAPKNGHYYHHPSHPPLDDCQITHLICVRLKHLLYDFWGAVLGLLLVVFLYKRPKNSP